MLKLELFTKPDCELCKPFCKTVESVARKLNLNVQTTNIETSHQLLEKYGEKIPCLEINGRLAFKYKVTTLDLLQKIKLA